MDVYEGKCTCGDADCARVLVIEPVFRVSIVDETDELAVTEIMTRDQLLDWVFSDDDCVIQNAINELSIEPDGTSVWQWLDGAEDAALRRQLAKMEIDGAVGRELLSILRQQLAITEAEAADLRRQVEHANNWRDSAILEANEARAEAADLRRQLAEAEAEIAALRTLEANGDGNSPLALQLWSAIYPDGQPLPDTPHRAGKGDTR